MQIADDTTIYFKLEEFEYLKKKQSDIISKVNTWLKLNKLSLNAQNTKLMFSYRKQKDVGSRAFHIYEVK